MSKKSYLVAFSVFAALLLLATAAESIKKKPRPRIMDDPQATSDQPPPIAPARTAIKVMKPDDEEERQQTPAGGETQARSVADEERKHLRRMARINRIQVLGIETENQGLVDLAREVRDKETRRHELAMTRLERSLPTGGER